MIKYFSPTSFRMFENDREGFFKQYMCGKERMAQTEAMAIGSAFDAYIKGELADIFGFTDKRFIDFFEDSVEEKWRTVEMLEAAAWLFKCYVTSGAAALLVTGLKSLEPQSWLCEERLEGMVADVVPISGFPDLVCLGRDFVFVLDWKVNGFFSTGHKKTRFVSRENGTPEYVGRGYGMSHKDCWLRKHVSGMAVHGGVMADIDRHWADQLEIYYRCLGVPIEVGVVGIDQLVCKMHAVGVRQVEVVRYRTGIGVSNLEKRLLDAWELVSSGWIFDDMDRERSDMKCAVLKEIGSLI